MFTLHIFLPILSYYDLLNYGLTENSSDEFGQTVIQCKKEIKKN